MTFSFSSPLFTKLVYGLWFQRGFFIYKAFFSFFKVIGWFPISFSITLSSSICLVKMHLFQICFVEPRFIKKIIFFLEKHASLFVLKGVPVKLFIKSYQSRHVSPFFIIEDVINLISYRQQLSFLLAHFIAFLLEKSTRHSRVLDGCFQQISSFFSSSQNVNLLGIRIVIQGRINGTDRSKKVVFSQGFIRKTSLSVLKDYGEAFANTPYGALGIKVWCSYK